ncbi:MAG TPA: L,D-transpeptidase family protein [Anaerolineales bacterium]|nr:L,D-transpeptidase family protein [Anaerolineales bacterium]
MRFEITQPATTRRSRSVAARPPVVHKRPRDRGLVRRLILAVGIMASIGFGLPALLAAGIYGYVQLTDTIVPGVWIEDLPVEGLTLRQATYEIDRIWNVNHSLKLIDNTDVGRTWEISPSEVGLSVDSEATAKLAFDIGRQRDIRTALSSMYSARTQPVRIHPIVNLDPAVAQAGLENWAVRAAVAPVDGYVRIDEGTLTARDGQDGKTIDLTATGDFLASSADAVMTEYGFLPLIMRSVAPEIGSVSDATGEAQRLMNASFSLRAYDPVTDEWLEWTPGLGIIAGWLEVERQGEGTLRTALSVELIEERLDAYVEGLNESLGEERYFDVSQAVAEANAGLVGSPTDPILIHYRPTTRQVGYGETWISIGWRIGIPPWRVQAENPQISGRNPLPGETINIPARDANLALPIVIGKRIVVSISEQHMWVYENGELRSDHVVSTGIARSPTMPGVFQIESHYENAYASNWDLWMPNFMGIYDALPGFTNGFHGLPTLSNGVRLWANVLGRPASYGCIILDLDAAQELYDWAEDGVIVEVDA